MLVFWRYASRRCEKMGKFNLWLFSTQIQMISKCIFRQRVHNEMPRKKKTFPYAVTIVSFNFCEMFFSLSFFESVIYCIRFCFISFTSIEPFFVAHGLCETTSVTLHLIDFWEHLWTLKRAMLFSLWKCEKSMSKFSHS